MRQEAVEETACLESSFVAGRGLATKAGLLPLGPEARRAILGGSCYGDRSIRVDTCMIESGHSDAFQIDVTFFWRENGDWLNRITLIQ